MENRIGEDFEIDYTELLDEDDEMIDLEDYDYYQDMLDSKDDYIQNLEYENRNMAEFLESLGFSGEQISDICLSGKLYISCPDGNKA